MNIIEENKNIAELIGMSKNENRQYLHTDIYGNDHVVDGENYTLYFSRSWDWLMLAVDKLRKLGYGIRINSGFTDIYDQDGEIVTSCSDSCMINATYTAIVKLVGMINQSNLHPVELTKTETKEINALILSITQLREAGVLSKDNGDIDLAIDWVNAGLGRANNKQSELLYEIMQSDGFVFFAEMKNKLSDILRNI